MKIDEFLKNEKNLDQAAKCKDIGEFKKFIDKNDVFYFTEEQLKKAWSYVRACSPDSDGGLADDALEVVAGGVVDIQVGEPLHDQKLIYGCVRKDEGSAIKKPLHQVEIHNNGRFTF